MITDTYQTQKEQAENIGGLFVLKNLEDLSLRIWRPRATKPYIAYRFSSLERLEACLSNAIANFQAHQKEVADRRAKNAATPEKLAKVNVGDIFYSSWGYDQTNVNFYQVVDKKGAFVWVRELYAQHVEDSGGSSMSDRVIAVKDNFRSEVVEKRKLQFWSQEPCFKGNYDQAYLWDGKPKYRSWYA